MLDRAAIHRDWFSNIRADLLAGLVVALALIPEAIALMDLPGASFQGNRAAVQQIVEAAVAAIE